MTAARPVINKALLEQLQNRLGYTFSDPHLLRRALTHRSFGQSNNERLEFLGDSILGAVIGHYLYCTFPEAPEGQLTRLRAALVKGETLAQVAREFNFSDCLVLGEGELKSGGSNRDSILADSLESVIGAIYLEKGFNFCSELVLKWFHSRLAGLEVDKPLKDTKTQLQEYLQGQGKPLPLYAIEKVEGQAHEQMITISCQINHRCQPFIATARSRKQAEKLAAGEAIKWLQENQL